MYVTAGFDWKPRFFFDKTIRLKSHEWKQVVCSGILKFCMRDLLGKERMTLFALCDVLISARQEELSIDVMDDLEVSLHRSLALLERDFPASINVMVFHLLHHLPMFLQRFGPVYGFWMYGFERFNSWISRRTLNRRYPEATITETYRLYELAHYICLSTKLPLEAFTLPSPQSEVVCTGEVSSNLSSDLKCLLHKFYQTKFPEYGTLVQRYNSERAKAASRHCLRQFPFIPNWVPQTGPMLSHNDIIMCKGPTSVIKMLKYHKYQDGHHRTILLGSERSEQDGSSCRNSYVAANLSSANTRFGRVQFLFSHVFCSVTTVFAFLTRYDGPFPDPESGLSFACIPSRDHPRSNPIVCVSQLSKPYVTAQDDMNPNKI